MKLKPPGGSQDYVPLKTKSTKQLLDFFKNVATLMGYL